MHLITLILHNLTIMRTTVNLSEDVHIMLSAMSERSGEPMGAIIDRLVRDSRKAPSVVRAASAPGEANYPSVARQSAVVTPEVIGQLLNDEISS